MKLTTTLALAAAFCTTLAFAEDQKPAPGAGENPRGGRQQMTPEQRADRLKQELGLTDDQTAKVKAVYEKNQDKFKALREDKSLSEEDRRAKFREMMKSTMEDVSAILTPEQKTKFQEQMQRRREGGKGGEKK
jgi:Spy/CpxP family protein refolding chaperone